MIERVERLVPRRLRRLVRYGFVGGMAAAVDIGLFAIFAKLLGFNYLLVATFSFFIATAVNYLVSIRLVFESGARFDKTREATLVFAASAAGYLFNQATLYACVEYFGIELVLSKIIATGSVFLWNFSARNFFIFKPASPSPGQAERNRPAQ